MKIEQRKWTEQNGWSTPSNDFLNSDANMVLVFGSRTALTENGNLTYLKNAYPSAEIILCSTAGEIIDTNVTDDSIVSTAVNFSKTGLKVSSIHVDDMSSSFDAGKKLASFFPLENLVHLFIISDGQKVNGSELIKGLTKNLPSKVSTTGGLAGDGSNFCKTLVGLNTLPSEGNIVAAGFYGNNLKVGFGSMGGWSPFGPERLITRSEKNILYELDGQSALGLYKKYLGDLAGGLPGAALFFPLSIKTGENSEPIVRTILSIDSNDQSLIFAGDMPEGAYARLMRANFERLIDGASAAAIKTFKENDPVLPELAILISCVGRKLVLGQRIEEEVEAVKNVLGEKTIISGFYSYGEISPFDSDSACELHNQTMTITTLTEI